VADDPAPGLDEPEAGRGLAGRLARLPAAHPSARPDAAGDTAVWRTAVPSTADRADRQRGGDQASEDAWWRGESDIWWRIPDRSAGGADYDDDIGGLDGLSDRAGAGDGTGDPGEAGGPAETGDPDEADGLDEADTGETDGQGGGTGGKPARTARRAPGPAGRDLGQREGHWGEVSGPRADPDHGSYRPWFGPGVSGDPWFAAGQEYPADG
jgi:hypothetical protein